MNYIPPIYRINNVEANNMVRNFNEHTLITWEHLLMIDHAYHCDDDDYCGGLSFIDRIVKKIGFKYPEWNAMEIRNGILECEDRQKEYLVMIKHMLGLYEDIEYYGL